MPDVIRLLSDHLANQIAAGEVIQRPASAVKELLENSVDSGATDIQLHLRDAGKELIHVIDNGSGMSVMDARMAFERHATSKIVSIEDLFRIRTMGFRGEALASIAAVAQVELRTRKQDTELGTRIVIQGSEVTASEPCSTPIGTSLMVKNLFYNVPARRHFLKSNTTEFRHILDEFTRVAMANPEVAFRLYHNGDEQFHLESGNEKQRVVGLLGGTATKNLVPVSEEAELLNIRGFIGKPEAAGRSRGSQFFFVNGRFIRNAYLNHAVTNAYEGLIQKDAFPFYVLFLEVNPARVDVNVHPTKQEVKFEDDRLMYAYLHAAVKHALARYNIAPSLDFTLDPGIQALGAVSLPQTDAQRDAAGNGYLQNTFSQGGEAHRIAPGGDLQRWKDAYGGLSPDRDIPDPKAFAASFAALQPLGQMAMPMSGGQQQPRGGTSGMLVLEGTMLLTTMEHRLVLIHMRRAMEAIWYRRMTAPEANGEDATVQRLLFPVQVALPPGDAVLISDVLPELRAMGFEISPLGPAEFAINGTPPGMPAGAEMQVLEAVADRLHHAGSVGSRREEMAAALAFRFSRAQLPAGNDALGTVVEELFASPAQEFTPGGKKVFTILTREDLEKLL